MKEIALVAIAFALVSLSSCTKTHTCTCTYTVGSFSQPKEIVSAVSTTAAAKAWCTGIQNELNSLPGASGNSCTVN